MSTNCCGASVPLAGSFEAIPQTVAVWQERLTAGLSRIIQASDQTMGHMEEEISQRTRDSERVVLAEAAQQKADESPPVCPNCGSQLSRVPHGHERSYQPRFGVVTIRRLRGWCHRCKCWRFPADHVLGLAEPGGCSPGVQEMAALAVSKLPVAQASAVVERLSGVTLPRATLDREARRQGQRTEGQRQERDEQMRRGAGSGHVVPELRLASAVEPFTLVIELAAWNFRERNPEDWGRSERLRQSGQEPEWWHLGCGGHLISLEPTGADDRRPIADFGPRHGDDAGRVGRA